MSVYLKIRKAYHTLVPESVRRMPLLARFMYKLTSNYGPHDLLYNKWYFDNVVDGFAQEAAPIFADLIMREWKPQRMIDVGCGTGALIQAMTRAGCYCAGLEYADAAIKTCQERGLNVRKFNIEAESISITEKYDLVTSMEVGEHLPIEKADRYVDLLVSLAPVVIYTAATPGQGGSDHVNEQPHCYWIEKFEARGFHYEKEHSEKWRRATKERKMPYFYSDNIMIFQSSSAPGKAAREN